MIGAHHKLTVECIARLVRNRLTIVKSQPIQCLDSVSIEMDQATHQGCSFHGELGQGLLGLCSLVLFYFKQTSSKLLYVGLQGSVHQNLSKSYPNHLNPKYAVLGQGLLGLCSLVLFYLQQTGSQLEGHRKARR